MFDTLTLNDKSTELLLLINDEYIKDNKDRLFDVYYYWYDNNSYKSRYKIIKRRNNNIITNKAYDKINTIIVNNDNTVVCISPPKFTKLQHFMNKNKNIDEVLKQEYLEGTGVNLFWDNCIGLSGGWEISTNNKIGGHCNSYVNRNKTFRDMFLEIIKQRNIDLNVLDKQYCYNFIIQCKEFLKVKQIINNNIYLRSIYEIINVKDNNNNLTNVIIKRMTNMEINESFIYLSKFLLPSFPLYTSYKSLISSKNDFNQHYSVKGIILYNKNTNDTTVIRNKVFDMVLNIEKNNYEKQIECLQNNNNYLKGKNKKETNEYYFHKNNKKMYTKQLYNNYISCFILKKNDINEYPRHYIFHMKKLNEIYRRNKKCIDYNFVIQYVNNLHVTILSQTINFPYQCKIFDDNIIDDFKSNTGVEL